MNDRRVHIKIAAGEPVQIKGIPHTIIEVIDLKSVFVENNNTGRKNIAAISELRPSIAVEQHEDLELIADKDWIEAERRFNIIRPFIEGGVSGRKEVELRAQEHDINPATIYRWLKIYKAYGTIDGLRPRKEGLPQGKKIINKHAEAIIEKVIKDLYLTNQRISIQKVVLEVKRLCHEYHILDVPHANTVRNRIAAISQREALRKRGHKEKADNKFTPAAGKFPHADYPLAVVQIDHTPVDLILVDDFNRRPIGRPFLTLAIDVYSRVVVGYYLSLDAPSVMSIAMSVSQAVLPKEKWLASRKIQAEWPVWGIMNTIHVDNGPEFHSETFRNACMAHDIRLEYRPVKKPRFGGHIERLMGTFATDIHAVPGTTFSNIFERKGYNSDTEAVFTFSEFEDWLIDFICNVYHKRKHSALGTSPLHAFELGIFGDKNTLGSGAARLPANDHNFFLDFLPSFERTIQTTGVTIDGLAYYADVLRGWINAVDPDNQKEKRKFIFRRDPRNISEIWFFDPEIKNYFKVPLADQSIPPFSIWEHKKIQELKKETGEYLKDHELGQALAKLRERVQEASTKTRRARRSHQRSTQHLQSVNPASIQGKKPQQNSMILEQQLESVYGLLPLDELENDEDIS
ncbi:Mu transposase C-terminal domain-containing protein [Acinetobacter baumannii]|uniref:Mu transposase C-terminal domain-containing protein n=1 Tax=Acinetobacter baumannii TaxID=470 RepID=UPI00396CC16A